MRKIGIEGEPTYVQFIAADDTARGKDPSATLDEIEEAKALVARVREDPELVRRLEEEARARYSGAKIGRLFSKT